MSNITKRNVALAYGFLCICRMTTNMQSTRMTKAYNTQMTAMSLPFFTSILARIFLNETILRALFPALLVMLVGSICVFYGQGAFSSSGENSVEESFTNEDIAGIALQLLSVLFSSLVKIAFKSTEGVLSKIELLLSQFTVSAFPLLCYTLIYQRYVNHPSYLKWTILPAKPSLTMTLTLILNLNLSLTLTFCYNPLP